MAERDIERYLTERVRDMGGIAFKFSSPARRGVPDRIVTLPNGVLAFIEVKTACGKLTGLQKQELRRLRELGQKAFVVRSSEDVESVLNELRRA